LVTTASCTIGSDSDTEIPAVAFEEYHDVLDEDTLRGTILLLYIFEPPLEVSTNHRRGNRSAGCLSVNQQENTKSERLVCVLPSQP